MDFNDCVDYYHCSIIGVDKIIRSLRRLVGCYDGYIVLQDYRKRTEDDYKQIKERPVEVSKDEVAKAASFFSQK